MPTTGTNAHSAAAAAAAVYVLAPLGRDAAVICRALGDVGVACAIAGGVPDLAAAVGDGRTGAAVVTEEALTPSVVGELAAALAGQPAWSDLPVLLLMTDGERFPPRGTRGPVGALRAAGNVAVLVRPVPTVALVTAVQAALRARRRQYEVRDLIDREHAARTAAEHSAREADRANRLKDEFLATVSHELRTPLSAILLWSKLAAGGRIKPPDLPEALRNIERSAHAQSQLIDDLLDAARMTTGKLRLNARACELEPAVRSAVDVVRPTAEAKGVRVEVALDPAAGLVLADPDRLQQVVWNLLSNAVKFTPRGGDVLVRLGRDGGHARVDVTDTGQGIGPDFLPHVFERFRQADPSAGRRQGGLGLGLAITYQLVELHGGTIAAESDGEGRGSTFTVRLPLASPAAAPDAAAGPPDADAAAREPARVLDGLRVLLVDDDTNTRRGMAWALEDAGAEVTAVGSAADAVRALLAAPAAGRPHVLVSDIGMPGEDGYRLIERVRALGPAGGGDVPAVAVTAYGREADRGRALAAGFQAHLRKPLDPDGLVAAVAALAARPAE